MTTENPFSPPLASLEQIEPEGAPRVYGGIGRLAFLGFSTLILLFRSVTLMITPATSFMAIVCVAGFVGSYLIAPVPAYFRLKSIGNNPWWCFLMLVPVANLFVWVRCAICPQGFADNGKLDTPAKIMGGIAVVVLLLMAFLLLLAMYLNI